MEQIRVLHVLGSLDIGGAETMVMNILRSLDRSEILFDFAVPGNGEGYYAGEIQALGGRIHPFTKRRESFWKNHREFAAIIRKNNYKTIHFHTQNAFLTVLQIHAARKAGAQKIMVHSHNTRDWREGKLLFLHKCFRKSLCKYSDIQLSCGKEAAQWLYGTKEGIEIIPLPVDCDKFCYDEEAYARLRKEAGFANQTVYAHVGRFSEVKNHEFLIEIFKELKKIQKDAVLMLMGSGEGRPLAEAKVREYHLEDAVFFLGNVAKVYEKLKMADVFLFPSKYEGFPTVVLEAQAAGLPCYISDRITEDISVTDLVKRLSLEMSARAWATEILKEEDRKRTSREFYNKQIREIYDSSVSRDRLSEIYKG